MYMLKSRSNGLSIWSHFERCSMKWSSFSHSQRSGPIHVALFNATGKHQDMKGQSCLVPSLNRGNSLVYLPFCFTVVEIQPLAWSLPPSCLNLPLHPKYFLVVSFSNYLVKCPKEFVQLSQVFTWVLLSSIVHNFTYFLPLVCSLSALGAYWGPITWSLILCHCQWLHP